MRSNAKCATSQIRLPIDDVIMTRFVHRVRKSYDSAYSLRELACKAIDALTNMSDEDKKTRVRHLRVIADKAVGLERELFPAH